MGKRIPARQRRKRILDSTQQEQPLARRDINGSSGSDIEKDKRTNRHEGGSANTNEHRGSDSESREETSRITKQKRKTKLGPTRSKKVGKARRYTPPDCSICAALRTDGKSYTRVYATKRKGSLVTRYIHCDYCGNSLLPVVTKE